MDLNRIINMVANQIIRRVVNMAVDGGMRFASRKTAELSKPDPETPATNDIGSPAEQAKDAQLRNLADKAAATTSLTRRTLR